MESNCLDVYMIFPTKFKLMSCIFRKSIKCILFSNLNIIYTITNLKVKKIIETN